MLLQLETFRGWSGSKLNPNGKYRLKSSQYPLVLPAGSAKGPPVGEAVVPFRLFRDSGRRGRRRKGFCRYRFPRSAVGRRRYVKIAVRAVDLIDTTLVLLLAALLHPVGRIQEPLVAIPFGNIAKVLGLRFTFIEVPLRNCPLPFPRPLPTAQVAPAFCRASASEIGSPSGMGRRLAPERVRP